MDQEQLEIIRKLQKILSGFQKTIVNLEKFQAEQADVILAQQETIARAQDVRNDAEYELGRASKIRANLEKLLEV